MTPAEQKAALELATESVNAVRRDEQGPFGLPDFEQGMSRADVIRMLKTWWSRIDLQAFQLAQLCVNQDRALELACAELEAGDADDKAIAKRLRALDLPDPASDEPADASEAVTAPGVPPLPTPPKAAA